MIRDLLLKDWGGKLFSLFLAVAIWLTVDRILEPEAVSLVGRTSTLTYENLNVRLVSSSANAGLFRAVPSVVRVTVSGPRDVMNRLQASQVRAEVDVDADSSVAGTGAVNIIAPPNVTLVEVEPQTVSIIAPSKP